MKNGIKNLIFGVLFFVFSSVGTYSVMALNGHKSQPQISDDSNAQTEFTPPVEEESNLSKMFSKLLDSERINAEKLSITLSTATTEDVILEMSGLDFDISSIVNEKALKVKTGLTVKYDAVEERVNLVYQEDELYLNYRNSNFAFAVPDLMSGLLPSLKRIGISLPSISISSIDTNGLLDYFSLCLEEAVETVTPSGYEFELDVSVILRSVLPDYHISNAQVILQADSDLNLTGLRTSQDGLKIGDDLKVSFLASGLKSSSGSFVGLTADEKQNYSDLTNDTNSLFTTLADLVENKSFVASYDVSLNTENGLHSLNGELAFDTDGANSIDESSLEIVLNHSKGEVEDNFYAFYQRGDIYFKADNLIKGKLTAQTVEDISSLLSSNGENEAVDSAESLNSIIAGTEFEKLMNGDLTNYDGFLVDFNLSSDGFYLAVDSSYFGLEANVIEINAFIEDSNINLRISNVLYKGLNIDVNISLRPEENIVFTETDFSSYKDYCGLLSLYDSLSSLLSEKKFSADYSLTLAGSDVFQAQGQLKADLTNVDADSGKYGDYQLSIITNSEYPHNAECIYQNNDIYIQFDDIFKQSIADSEISRLLSLLEEKTGTPNEAFAGVSDALSIIKGNLLSEFTSSYTVKYLENYFTIDEDNLDPDVLILQLKSSSLLSGTGYENLFSDLTLSVSTSAFKPLSLSFNGFAVGDYTLDFSLEFAPFESFLLSEEEQTEYTRINTLPDIVSSLFSVEEDFRQFNLDLDGSIENKSGSKLGLEGNACVDLTDENDKKAAGVVNLLQESDSNYSKATDHEVIFSHKNRPEIATSSVTLASYTSRDLKDDGTLEEALGSTNLIMRDEDIFSIYDRVVDLQNHEENLLYPYLKGIFEKTGDIMTGLDLVDIIINKDYQDLLNGYFKKVSIDDYSIQLQVSSKLFDSASIETILDLNISFSQEFKIQSAQLNGELFDCSLSLNLELSPYDDSKAVEIEYNADTFVDFKGFDTLLACGIQTTEHSFYDLSGQLQIDPSLIGLSIPSISISTYITCYVQIVDNDVLAYLAFNNNNSTIDDKNFYGTEFFVENDICYTAKTTTTSRGVKSVSVRKLEAKEILDNAIYYILEYILNVSAKSVIGVPVGNIILGNVYGNASSSSLSTTITHSYSSIVSKADYEIGTESDKFSLVVNLQNFLQVESITLNPLSLDITTDKTQEITGLELSMSVNCFSVINADVRLSLTRNVTDDIGTKMDRYNAFVNAFKGDEQLSSLDYYQITSITAKTHWLYSYSGITVTDNGNYLDFSYSEDTKIFFYGITA